MFKNFLLMIQFFTRIPVKRELPCESKDFKRGTTFLAVVGMLLGILGFIVFGIFYLLTGEALISILFYIGAELLLTGAMHLDGLADVFDSFFIFGDSGKRQEIMKDSRIGTFGAAAAILQVLAEGLLLAAVFDKVCGQDMMLFLLTICSYLAYARYAVNITMYIAEPAKQKGTGNLFIGNTGIPQVLINLIIPSIILAFTVNIYAAVTTGAVLAALAVLFNLLCVKKIGGQTGDTMGAVHELSKLITLVIMLFFV